MRMLKHLAASLIQGERIEIRGFGSFNLHHRTPHIARNPRTGEAVNSPAKVKVHLKLSKEMKDRVNASRNQCEIEEWMILLLWVTAGF